ncbi:MAG: hypothetical protein GF331_21510 [Chitinivibrionales bacterium]|nr:hypothetical protein [Chitinivibrionales bacterium]
MRRSSAVWNIVLLIPLLAGGVMAKDLVKIGGSVVVEEGQVVKDAVAVGGTVTVRGEVTNDAVAVGGSVILEPGAVVRGDVVSVGGKVQQAEGARVEGGVTEVAGFFPAEVFGEGGRNWPAFLAGMRVVTFIGFLALALVAVALFGGTFASIAAEAAAHPVQSGLWGLLALVLVPPFAVLLAVSLIGIPLIPLLIILVVCCVVVGYIGAGLLVGERVAGAVHKPDLSKVLAALIGLALLWAVGWVPFLGWLVQAVAALVGFGAVLVLLRGAMQRRQSVRPNQGQPA